MQHIIDIAKTRKKARAHAEHFIRKLRAHARKRTTSLEDTLERLRVVRRALYEDLNQIQHECLVLEALDWLRANGYQRCKWFWNPRQTGNALEPDLMAKVGERIVVSAEITTSESPSGLIDSRMRDTLGKLRRMPGKRFYFVRTESMVRRALTKVRRNAWDVQVVNLDKCGQS